MIDTNLLISAIVHSSLYLTKLIDIVADNHIIVLSTYLIDELKETTAEKFPTRFDVLESVLEKTPYMLLHTPETFNPAEYPYIRDKKDLPILVSAINENVDVLLTNDKDFLSLDVKHPEILTPLEFLEKYHA
jgi:putative PIN family toxin of toxin-antitoxin system